MVADDNSIWCSCPNDSARGMSSASLHTSTYIRTVCMLEREPGSVNWSFLGFTFVTRRPGTWPKLSRIERLQPEGLPESPLYSHVVRTGSLVFLAGQVAQDE